MNKEITLLHKQLAQLGLIYQKYNKKNLNQEQIKLLLKGWKITREILLEKRKKLPKEKHLVWVEELYQKELDNDKN